MDKEVKLLRSARTMVNTPTSHSLEELRNRILNVEARCQRDLGALAQQLHDKFQENDDIDMRLKEAIEKTFADTVLGQRVIEVVTAQLQSQTATVDQMRCEMVELRIQLDHSAAQLLTWNHDHRQMDAEISRLGAVVAGWHTGEQQHSVQGPAEPQNRDGAGPAGAPAGVPPGMPATASGVHHHCGAAGCGAAAAQDPWAAFRAAATQPYSTMPNMVHSHEQGPHVPYSMKPNMAHSLLQGLHMYNMETPQPFMGSNSGERRCRFSEKVATMPQYQYDGEKNGAQWRLIVKPYFMSKA